MDVGVELRELRASGRLGAFARALGVNTHEALGVLCDVWHETQHREIVLVTEPQFAEATGLVLLHDPRIVLAAMVAAQLATPAERERWLIRGNDRHVDKLKKYRAAASIGGKRSVEVRQATGKRSLKQPVKQPVKRPLEDRSTQTQANVKPSGSDLEPWILDTGVDHDLDPSDPYLIQNTKSEDLPTSGKTPKNGVSPSSRIRAAYLAGYEKKFGRPFGGWGAKANGQASQLIRDWPVDRAIELLALFFDWNHPRAISAGYPFGFFVSAIHEIDADTHSPERKRLARTLDAAERQVSHKDAEQLTLDAELAQIRARRAGAERKALGAPSPTGVAP